MARSRIKGITVEIGGDTTKLQRALKGGNSEIKNTQAQARQNGGPTLSTKSSETRNTSAMPTPENLYYRLSKQDQSQG